MKIVFFGVLLGLVVSNQGQSLYRKPLIYIAGPDQLSLIEDNGGFRFAYEASNQFRAERRHPNGTVEGRYGYIGADGKPVVVTYTSRDEEGFHANSEEIPVDFGTESLESTSDNAVENEHQNQLSLDNTVENPESDSVSVFAADYEPAQPNGDEPLVRKTRGLVNSPKLRDLKNRLKKKIAVEKAQKNLPLVKKWFHNLRQKMARKQSKL